MTKHTTFAELLAIQRDIETQSRISPSYSIFHAQKIKNFLQQNSFTLKRAHTNLARIMNQYINVDDDGKWKTKKAENGVEVWDFITPESEAAYINDYEEFVEKPITINL